MRFKKISRVVFLGVAFISLSLLCSIVQTQIPAKPQIAFYSARDGNFEIYVIDIDGNNLRRLTNNPAEDWAPSWSPDGRWIAFFSGENPNYDTYLMDADGKNVRKLIDRGGGVTWAPDSQHVAFYSKGEIHTADINGKNIRNLTNHPATDVEPAWSPDGQKIAFKSNRDGNWEIYVMDVDGQNIRRLTNHLAMDDQPAWSPDSQWIAFRSYRDKNGEIYVMDADGKNLCGWHYPFHCFLALPNISSIVCPSYSRREIST